MPLLTNHNGGLRAHYPRQLLPKPLPPGTTLMMTAPAAPHSSATATATAIIRPAATAVIPQAGSQQQQHNASAQLPHPSGSSRRKGHPERLTSEALGGDEVISVDKPTSSTAAIKAGLAAALQAAVASTTSPHKTPMMVSPVRPNRTDSAPSAGGMQTDAGLVAKKSSTSSDSGVSSRPASSTGVRPNGSASISPLKRPAGALDKAPSVPEPKRPCQTNGMPRLPSLSIDITV